MAVGTDPELFSNSELLAPLVARACAGEEEALEELVSSSYDRVFPLCRRVVGNDADAAEVARDALIAALRSVGSDGEERYVTFLYRSAVASAATHTRRRSRRRAPASNDVSLIASESDLDSMVESIDLDLALMEVPLELRVAVVLRDLCGLAYPRIADIVEASDEVVVSRVARGRDRLVELLGARLAPDPASVTDGSASGD